MPELPEVETICNELAPIIKNRRISGFELLWQKTLKGIEEIDFSRNITGKTIKSINRRGKYILVNLEGELCFSVHLKMTGSLTVLTGRPHLPVHTRAVFWMENKAGLFFIDPRKFGRIEVVNGSHPAVVKLGPEPLEQAFTAEIFGKILAGKKAPVKTVLIDQHNIAGVGNMYADEALYMARIHPLRPAGSLSSEELDKLHHALQSVLITAIENKGATINNYTRPGGQAGLAQNEFKVAHQRGKKCTLCDTPLERITVRQRGTYLCPSCQVCSLPAQVFKG